MMRVLVDVSHPAHVHLFRNAIEQLQAAGHTVCVTSREKDVTTTLLDAYGIAHVPLSAKSESKLGLLTEWGRRELRMLSVARAFDPDVVVSRLNPPATHAAAVLGCPSVVFDDSEVVRFAGRITHPFADVICTPTGYQRDLGEKQRRYDGFHELAYLHPDRFSPDADRLSQAGVDPAETYAVVRFVSWGAHHDVGQQGLSRAGKRKLVDTLAEHGSVYIASESPLPSEFEPYRLPVEPDAFHDLLAFADLYVGDSQTTAVEAGVLGTPAVRTNSFVGDGMGNFLELEAEYDLLRSLDDERDAIAEAERLLGDRDAPDRWADRRQQLVAEKIDVTQFVVDTVLAEGAA
jgi:hypothetical protein